MTATTLTLGGIDWANFPAASGYAYGQDQNGDNSYNYNLIYSNSYFSPYKDDYSVEKAFKDAILKSETNTNINNLVEVVTENPIPSIYSGI